MNEREFALIKALGEEFGQALQVLREEFQKSLEIVKGGFDKQIEEIRQAIPQPTEIEIPDFSKMVSDAAAQIKLPDPPELPDFSQMVADAVSSAVKQAVEEMPKPQDGKSLSADELRPLVEQVVTAAMPEPVDVKSLLEQAITSVPKPKDGDAGRDALDIELEPCIDEAKSYPRGTFATHNGGLWRAHEKTHGMRGWECIVDGVCGVDITQDHQRNFTITLSKSSGEAETKSFDVPVTIYRDVFKSGTEYQPGDTVTWGGSLWHCNEVTSDKPGENGSKGWTLAVKKGRDLRDKP